MSRRGFSPLERRALLALVSLIRDQPEPDTGELIDVEIKPSRLYERMYVLDPDRSYELQCRNQRQAIRRALDRLQKQGYISAIALAWVNVADECVIRFQGGGRLKRDASGYLDSTPRWAMVSVTRDGLKVAELMERESTVDGAP